MQILTQNQSTSREKSDSKVSAPLNWAAANPSPSNPHNFLKKTSIQDFKYNSERSPHKEQLLKISVQTPQIEFGKAKLPTLTFPFNMHIQYFNINLNFRLSRWRWPHQPILFYLSPTIDIISLLFTLPKSTKPLNNYFIGRQKHSPSKQLDK